MPSTYQNVAIGSFPEELEQENQEGRYYAALHALLYLLINIREVVIGDLNDTLYWKMTHGEDAQRAYAEAITKLVVLMPDVKQAMHAHGENEHGTPETALKIARTMLDFPFHEELRERWEEIDRKLESSDKTEQRAMHQELAAMWTEWMETRKRTAEELKQEVGGDPFASDKRGEA